MQSQNYFYQHLKQEHVTNERIKTALAVMPTISDKNKASIVKALDAGNYHYARHELANCLYNSLTLNETGIDIEAKLWKQWQNLIAKK